MQTEKSNCPTDIWLSTKICLPDGKRGFAIGKLVETEDRSLNLHLTLDQTLLGSSQEKLLGISKWNSILASFNENLGGLPKGTAILLSPPVLFGVKFWIARIGQIISSPLPNQESNFPIVYNLLELKKLHNFLEARSAQRVSFCTSAFLIDPKNYALTKYYTHDISAGGLSLSIDSDQENVFEINENYLLQIQLHESLNITALNYRCVHIREDILTGAKIVGLALNDRKAKDPEVEYNLTLLTWQDTKQLQEDLK